MSARSWGPAFRRRGPPGSSTDFVQKLQLESWARHMLCGRLGWSQQISNQVPSCLRSRVMDLNWFELEKFQRSITLERWVMERSFQRFLALLGQAFPTTCRPWL